MSIREASCWGAECDQEDEAARLPKGRIMTFRPTMDEWKRVDDYVEHMEYMGAHLAGIAKVPPPLLTFFPFFLSAPILLSFLSSFATFYIFYHTPSRSIVVRTIGRFLQISLLLTSPITQVQISQYL